MTNLIFADQTFKIIGACFEVYKRMGCGFLEEVYQECLEIEFNYQSIPFIAQPSFGLTYRENNLKKKYRSDFICFDKIIVEIKTVTVLISKHRSQIINYLNATGFKVGLLVNFGHFPKLEYERFVCTKKKTFQSSDE